MKYIIENDHIAVTVEGQGAELQSIINKTTGLDYMWNANPAYWAKHSPILFPIVGALKENTFYYNDKAYQLPRHGFAREMQFELHKQTNDELSFLLKSNAATLDKYPFSFQLYIDYSINKDSLMVTYRVMNDCDGPMYFSIGGHPAFKIPVLDGEVYEDYSLQFNKKEVVGRWPITINGLLDVLPEPFFENTNTIRLKKELFNEDAIVLKHLNSNSVKLISDKTGKGFEFDFTGFPFLGIWAAKGADFVCIEPWCGIADSENTNQQLTNKEGIVLLNRQDAFKRSWKFSIIS